MRSQTGCSKTIALVIAILCSVHQASGEGKRESPDRPNLVCIITDQQSATMMSCAGNKYLKTPAMDAIASRGMRFELAYAANPVCLPSRFSMLTGRMPSCVGIQENGDGARGVPESFIEGGIGHIFRNAGYETAYGGKVHLPKGMSPEKLGFEKICNDQRDELAQEGSEFIRRKHNRPFLLLLSFINPHDICYMAIRDHDRNSGLGKRTPPQLDEAMQLPKGVSEKQFFASLCPPLPENFEPQPDEPEIVESGLFQRTFKKYARENWSAERWRMHRWAYCRLTEKVDSQIGRVLQSLRDTGLEDDTVVIFTSDHGDMDSAHRLEHKTMLYEEAVRVPFIVSHPGVTVPGGVDKEHLISAGLDLIPTLCGYAGVNAPEGLTGRCVRPLAEGRGAASWRDQLVVEGQFGRMLRTARYKYVIYESGERREQLIDLQNDPGEMNNLIGDPECREIVVEHRRRLARHVQSTDDRIAGDYLIP